MGILDRFADIIKANINDLLDKAEDPAKIIDQYMRELTDIETLNARRETIKAKAAVAKTQAKVNQFTSGAGAAFAPRAASAGEAKAADKPAEGAEGRPAEAPAEGAETPAQVALYQFVAYGDGLFQLTDTERSRGHRVLLMNVREGADPAMVEEAARMSHRMQDFIDGFNNSKVAPVVESEGSNSWDYVFECDYEDPSVYSGAYLMHPIHITFIDRYFEPACEQWVFTPDLCTSVIEVDGPFLANYAD